MLNLINKFETFSTLHGLDSKNKVAGTKADCFNIAPIQKV